MKKSLKSTNILAVSNAYPNPKTNFMQGIFIKNQIDSIKDHFNKINVIAPIFRDFGIMEKGKKCIDYSYDNVSVFYPRSFFVPYNYSKIFNIDFRIAKVKQYFRENSIEDHIIHTHFGIMGKAIVPIKRKMKIPFLTSFYGYDAYQYSYNTKYYSELFARGDHLIVLSEHMKKRLMELGCPETKIVINHIGIDIDNFQPIKKEKESDEKNILVVANFVEKKGILDAISAFDMVQRKHKNVKLNILGKGPLLRKIQELIESKSLSNKISIIDNYSTNNPRKTVLDYMQKADIFLLPSKRDSSGDCEGTPVVLMEASACNLPCVTTQHSGNPEIIIHEKTGFIAPEGNIEKLSEYLIMLLEDRNLALKFGDMGRKHITMEFNSKIQSERLLSIYKNVIESL